MKYDQSSFWKYVSNVVREIIFIFNQSFCRWQCKINGFFMSMSPEIIPWTLFENCDTSFVVTTEINHEHILKNLVCVLLRSHLKMYTIMFRSYLTKFLDTKYILKKLLQGRLQPVLHLCRGHGLQSILSTAQITRRLLACLARATSAGCVHRVIG